MTKRTNNRKDFNEIAHEIGQIATGETLQKEETARTKASRKGGLVGGAARAAKLSPEDRSNSLVKVRIQVSKKDRSVKSWKMFKKNGNRYTYTIRKFQPNPPMDATTFNFDKTKYKGV